MPAMSLVPDPEPTEQLLGLWHGGDAQALARLVEREMPWIRQLVQRRMGRRLGAKFEADDFVQDAVVDLLRYGPRFVVHDTHQFRGLVARIVENNLRDRDEWFRARRRALDRERELTGGSALNLDPVEGSVTRPSEVAVRNEAKQWVRLALELLEPEDRRVIVRREWDGASFVEIGEELAMSANAVRMRWVRAVARLADKVRELQNGSFARACADESIGLTQPG